MKRLLLAVLLSGAGMAQGETLAELQARLAAPGALSGSFVQEKHLRALAQPLTSSGRFELTTEQGLLWQLLSPLQRDYRIDEHGIAQRTPQGWQKQPGRDAAAYQSKLFLALLRGDRQRLEEDFQVSHQGDANAWQIELVPRSALLQQIFSRITVQGGAQVERIELFETQGDRTLLRLQAEPR